MDSKYRKKLHAMALRDLDILKEEKDMPSQKAKSEAGKLAQKQVGGEGYKVFSSSKANRYDDSRQENPPTYEILNDLMDLEKRKNQGEGALPSDAQDIQDASSRYRQYILNKKRKEFKERGV